MNYREDLLYNKINTSAMKNLQTMVDYIINNSPHSIPDNANQTTQLYRQIRTEEKKVPSLILLRKPDMNRKIPSYTIDSQLIESIETKCIGELSEVYFNKTKIVSFSQKIEPLAVIDEPDMKGSLYMNEEFFLQYDIPKRIESDSDVRNVAKTFFKVNDKNYVALVQYLASESSSSEHYHKMEEYLIQLQGISYLETRPIDKDTSVTIRELNPGDIVTIPPKHLHQIYTDKEGSITIPIKKTNGKKDHLYLPRSNARITEELEMLQRNHYESGRAFMQEIEMYRNSLSTQDRKTFDLIVKEPAYSQFQKFRL